MIIPATDRDLAYIEAWLKAEHLKSGDGFWRKWPNIQRAHQDGRLLVLREGENAIAFHTHGEMLGASSIIEVHPDRRRLGVGKALVKHLIQKAKNADSVLLEIQYSEGSKRFWQSRSFQAGDSHLGTPSDSAYFPLEKELTLPGGGVPMTVIVKFFEANGPKLLSEHQVEGQLLNDGSIALARRIIGFSIPTSPDVEVTVSVDGRTLFGQGRAKYQKSFGLIYKDDAFYLDRIPAGEAALRAS